MRGILNVVDRELYPYLNKRIALIEHASRQDYLICITTISLVLLFSPIVLAGYILYISPYFYYFISTKTTKLDNFSHIQTPSNTYFVADNNAKYNDLATKCFYFKSFIFYPTKSHIFKCQHFTSRLTHEFSHCGQGEALIFSLTTAAIVGLIGLYLRIVLVQLDDYFWLLIFITIIALYLCISCYNIMHRREHIADYKAFIKLGETYIKFIENEAENNSLLIDNNKRTKLFNFSWHPKWQDRLDFIKTQELSICKEYIKLCFSALLIGPLFVLYCIPVMTFVVYFKLNYWFGSIGIVLFAFCLFFLVAKISSNLPFIILCILLLSYSFCVSSPHLSFTFLVYYYGYKDVGFWGCYLVWGVLGISFVSNLLLLVTPLFQHSRNLALTVYMTISYIFANYFCGFIFHAEQQGVLPYFFTEQNSLISVLLGFLGIVGVSFLSYIFCIILECFRRFISLAGFSLLFLYRLAR